MRGLLLAAVLCAAMVVAVACSDARAERPPPNHLNVVAEYAQGDSVRLIAAWGAAQRGTYPISHYRTRIRQVGPTIPVPPADTLRWGATTDSLQVVDTLMLEMPAFGDSLIVRFGVQAADTSGATSRFVWSDEIDLSPGFVGPGEPGPVTVDTTGATLSLRIEPGSYEVYEFYDGPTVLTASYYLGPPSDATRIACAKLLVFQRPTGIVEVGKGVCTDDRPIVTVDSVYVPGVHGWRSPAWLTEFLNLGVGTQALPTAPAS